MMQKMHANEHWASIDLVLYIFKQLPNNYDLLQNSFDFISAFASSCRPFLDELAEKLDIIKETNFTPGKQFSPLYDVCSVF